jgi:hypothetical protein
MNDHKEIKSLNNNNNDNNDNVRLIKSPLFVRTHNNNNNDFNHYNTIENIISNSSYSINENKNILDEQNIKAKRNSFNNNHNNNRNLKPSVTLSNINATSSSNSNNQKLRPRSPDFISINQNINKNCVGDASTVALYANFKSLSTTSNYIISDSSENLNENNKMIMRSVHRLSSNHHDANQIVAADDYLIKNKEDNNNNNRILNKNKVCVYFFFYKLKNK